MSNANYSELRQAAKDATPGPWWAEGIGAPSMGGGNPGGWAVVAQGWRVAQTKYGSDDGRGNARYIAAASPEVVLGLLDEIDTLRVQNPTSRPAPHPPETCCGNGSWRGYLCPYHSGYRDGWDDYDEDMAERAVWDEMTGDAPLDDHIAGA